ncbi:MAG TPA: hypothetical protein VFU04_06420, partial [Solirubrobacterales bacterium]|nr:hypothetical protein [Solirubrobacterales bacterium]
LLVWMLIDDNESESSPEPAASSGGPEIVSVERLRDTAASSSMPIYWVGPPAGSRLELSQPSAERTFLRYLTGGATADDPRPFLTVGSYRVADATAVLRREGKRDDGVLAKAPEGGVVYFSQTRPESVYVAYPGEDVQVEVFAPDFQQALRLVTAGRIVPVE